MADINEEVLVTAHAHSMRNRQLLAAGGPCGCFYCMQTFDADEVNNWIDNGATALCPRCHIDSVLSSKADPVDPVFLKRMHAHWFERHVALDLTAELTKFPTPTSDAAQ